MTLWVFLFLSFFDVDCFFSLYWICYNIASVLCFIYFCREACGILAPRSGIEPSPPALEDKVPTTGPPGKSRLYGLEWLMIILLMILMKIKLSMWRHFYQWKNFYQITIWYVSYKTPVIHYIYSFESGSFLNLLKLCQKLDFLDITFKL